MKKVISAILVVAILMVIVPTASASRCRYHYPRADFVYRLQEGELTLNASRSRGCIEEYYWEIRACDCNYAERGYGRIYQTDIGPGRYWVSLTVTDRWGCEDTLTKKVRVPPKYYWRRDRRRRYRITKEERMLIWFIIGLAVIMGGNDP